MLYTCTWPTHASWISSNALDVFPRGAWFKYQLEHWLLLLVCFCSFLQSIHAIAGLVCWLRPWQHPSKSFPIHQYLCIPCYTYSLVTATCYFSSPDEASDFSLPVRWQRFDVIIWFRCSNWGVALRSSAHTNFSSGVHLFANAVSSCKKIKFYLLEDVNICDKQ